MEADTKRKYLLLVVVISSVSQRCLSQYDPCPVTIPNTVAYEGASASFTNVLGNKPVQWQVVSTWSGSGSLPINDWDGTLLDPFNTFPAYAVNQSHLIILSSTVAPEGSNPYSTAGFYTLIDQATQCYTAAGLIVIKSGPVCTCDPSNPNTLSCRVEYAEFSNQNLYPIMTWKDNTGVTVQTDTIAGEWLDPDNLQGQFWSASQLSVGNNNVYECQLTFSADQGQPYSFVTASAPDFTASCYISSCAPTTTAAPTTVVARNCSDQNLTNTVVYEGVPTSFPRVNNGQTVLWQVAPSSVSFNALKNITNYDNIVRSEFNSTYAVSGSQLTVFNSTVQSQGSMPYSTAGLYTLRYLNPNCTTAANLIVIRSGPVCTYNATNPSNATLNCSVVYAESTSQACYPIFTWVDSGGIQVKKPEQPVPTQINSYTRRSTSLLVIASTDTATYTCQLTFSAPAMSPLAYMAPNAPSFNASCSVSR